MARDPKMVPLILVAAVLGAGLAGGGVALALRSRSADLARKADAAAAAARAAEERAADLESRLASKTAEPSVPASSAPATSTPAASLPTRQFAYVNRVTSLKGAISLSADYAQFLTGDAAVKAAAAAGDEAPNDYFIVNDSKKLRELPVSPSATVRLTMRPDGSSEPDGFASSLAAFTGFFLKPTADNEGIRISPFWLTIKDGTVISIEQQYLP